MNQKRAEIELLNFIEGKGLDGKETTNPNNDDYTRCCILSGSWGVGKTYLINRICESKASYYHFANVSLFGLGSQMELKTRIIGKMCSFFTNPAKVFKRLVSTLSLQLGPVGIDFSRLTDALEDERIEALTKSKKEFVIILDDIERKDIGLSIVEILGTVAELLKNKNVKVILVTNFDKIKLDKECEDFKDFKEKVASRTFELNDVKAIIKDIVKTEKEDFNFGNNLRTIQQFRDILNYINDVKVDYPHIVKAIIYEVLRAEKEKIDIRKYELKNKKTDNNSSKNKSADLYLRLELVKEYVLDNIKLEYGEQEYIRDSVVKTIEHIYYAIFEGDYNMLLTIPKPQYNTFIQIPNHFLPGEKQEDYVLRILGFFEKAFKENTTHFSDTTYSFCEFLQTYRTILKENGSAQKKLLDVTKLFVKENCLKSVNNPEIAEMIYNGFTDALGDFDSNKETSNLKERYLTSLSKAISDLQYNSVDTIRNNLRVINSFETLGKHINYNFLSEIAEDNKGINAGIDYILSRCKEGNIDSDEWRIFKSFFARISRLLPSLNFSGKRLQTLVADTDSEKAKIDELFDIYDNSRGVF